MSILTVEQLALLPTGNYNISICFKAGVLEVGQDDKYKNVKTFRFHRGEDSFRLEIERGIIIAKKMVCGFILTFEISSDVMLLVD